MVRSQRRGWVMAALGAAVAAGAALRWLLPSGPSAPPPAPLLFPRFLGGPTNNALYPWASRGGRGFLYDPHGNMAASPSFGRRYLYGVTNSGRIFSLAEATGTVHWQRQVGQVVMTQPLLGPEALYIGLGNRSGFAKGGRILQGTGLGGVMALSRSSGRILWFHRSRAGIMPTGVLAKGCLQQPFYIGNTDHNSPLHFSGSSGKMGTWISLWALRLVHTAKEAVINEPPNKHNEDT